MSLAQFATAQTFFATVSGVIKAFPGRVFSAYGYNHNGTIRYLQLFNKATGPASNDVPLIEFTLPATDSEKAVGDDLFTVEGVAFTVGIAFGVSTARGSYTAATASDHDVTVVAS
jgi:hypothetical protein